MGAPGTTPGRWAVDPRYPADIDVGPITVAIAFADNDAFGSLANLKLINSPPEAEALANAHQIAASGALYDALKVIFDHWEAYTDPDADSPGWPDDAAAVMNDAWKDGFYEKARAALALARGEQS